MNATRPRLRALAAASLAALALSTLSACGDGGDGRKDGDRDRDPAPAASGSPTGSTPAPEPPVVLDAGQAPRRLLRIDVEKGHTERSTLQLTTTVGTHLEGVPKTKGTMQVPMTAQVTSTVTEATADALTVESVFGPTSVDPDEIAPSLVEPIRAALKFLEGTTVTVMARPDGTTLSTDVALGDDAPEMVDRMLDDFLAQGFGLAQLPPDEVGVGGRWRSTDDLEVGGTTVHASSTHEVVRLTDDGATLALTIEQTTQPGGAEGGGTIVEGSSSGRGRIELRHGMVLPVRSSSTIRGTSVVEVGDQRVTTTYTTEMTITTR
ncbi:hypothetical protein ACFJIY_24125 [Pimelobacter simplex]|uniref:hypothetical protein n=1 Tax=Nocardioides simplex TaxID=2045 RepID=UPI00366C469C